MKYKRTITKLFNDKYASIKDYEVEKAIELGGAEITHKPTNKKMTLSVQQLKEGLQKPTSREFNPNPRLNETKPFRLCNFFWQEQNENQLELI
tara:strand:+ start:93 stop:371 length:279 start_codon:yes stop_codon:yes gene_type:complete